MVYTLVAMKRASDVVWPTAEAHLCEREGWVRGTILPDLIGPEYVVDAMISGGLAVHRMIGKDGEEWTLDEGWTISTINGLRITCGGRVFATCNAALKVAEQMGTQDPAWIEWTEKRARLSDGHREKLCMLFEGAEADGEILSLLTTVR